MRPLLILKTGSTFSSIASGHGDFEDWIVQGLRLSDFPVIVLYPSRAESLPSRERFSGVIITGSHAMLTQDLPWMRGTAHWLSGLQKSPLPALGICFGHHLLARALGGEVAENHRGREMGTILVETTPAAAGDELLHGLEPAFSAHAAHSQSVVTLPPGSRLLARSPCDPHQAFCYGDRIWGLQFHPEFPCRVIRKYLELEPPEERICRDQSSGLPKEAEKNGRIILQRFMRVVQKCGHPC